MHSSAQICEYLYLPASVLFIEGGQNINHLFQVDSGMKQGFYGEEHFREGVKAPVISGSAFFQRRFQRKYTEIYLKNGS